MRIHKVLLSYTVHILHNDEQLSSLNCEVSICAYDCIFLSTAALVNVSEVADQVNDNLKHGVSFLCVRGLLLLIHNKKGESGNDVTKLYPRCPETKIAV